MVSSLYRLGLKQISNKGRLGHSLNQRHLSATLALHQRLVQQLPQRRLLWSGLQQNGDWQTSISDSFWNIRVPGKGSGFDNFFPKNHKHSETTEGEKEGSNGKQGGGNNFNEDGNNNNGDGGFGMNSTLLLLLLLGLVYINNEGSRINQQSTDGDSGSENRGGAGGASAGGPFPEYMARSMNWNDFMRLLDQGAVKRIVIHSPMSGVQYARVVLKDGYPGSSSLPVGDSDAFQHMEEHPRESFHSSEQSGGAATSIEGFHSDALPSGGILGASSGSSSPVPMSYRLQIGTAEAFEKRLEEVQRALGKDPSEDVPVKYNPESTMTMEIIRVLPWIALAAFGFAARGAIGGGANGARGGAGGMGGMFQIGRSTAKKFSKEDVKASFRDVAGCDEPKREIMEFVDFLKKPERFTKLGAKIPKGALLCGPPGTGKTLLAKAVAGEAGVPFFSVAGSEFLEMFVGVGPSRVRDLFSEARQSSPCIIFIDEIDSIGRARGKSARMGGNDERENTLNQLLVEMDGFDPSTGVVVLAGTNRDDILDQALTRPGRFDRKIQVDLPDIKGRREIFQVHSKDLTLEDNPEEIAGRLAGLTPGFSGADIANICNEAAIVAARRSADSVSMDDFEKATDRIIGGLESTKIMSQEERSIVAHHEAGHAVAGWFLEHTDPLLKVTIIPRASGALGFAQYLPREVFLRTKDQIYDIVVMALAGRAAEEIFFDSVTTGASDDLRRVTSLVYSTIQLYGMNERLGQLSFPKDPNAFFDERKYSEKTAKAMDEEAKLIVEASYQRTLDLLTEKKAEVQMVANMLLEKETISHDDILELLGPRPYKGDSQYEQFLRRNKKEVSQEDSQESKESEKSSENDASDAPSSGPWNPSLA